MLFPFTEKINQPNISETFITLAALNINFEQFYQNQKQIISWVETALICNWQVYILSLDEI